MTVLGFSATQSCLQLTACYFNANMSLARIANRTMSAQSNVCHVQCDTQLLT